MAEEARIKYIGKAEYCYANSAAMLLASINESVSPATIEVLSGVGWGAFWSTQGERLFFSNYSALPDEGIGRALSILGFEYCERWYDSADTDPLADLESVLAHGPAVLGPLDMGLLSYNPGSRGAGGADHFVLAYSIDEDQVYVNDPFGYPQVPITRADLLAAWRAELVPYRRGYYRSWSRPVRNGRPDEGEVFQAAMESFGSLYERSWMKAMKERVPAGGSAVSLQAKRINDGTATDGEIAFLTGFAFPISANRALDYGAFLEAGGESALASLRREQAGLFGATHAAAVAEDHGQLVDGLTSLARLEGSIEGYFKQARQGK